MVLDLCAGFQSIREEVLRAGAKYMAVDIQGKRAQRPGPPRRAAAVMCSEQKVLATLCKLPDGSAQWTLPGGQPEPTDHSAYATAVRRARETTGIQESMFQHRIRAGPEIIALPNTSYYALALSPILSQAELRRSFARRREDQNIIKTA